MILVVYFLLALVVFFVLYGVELLGECRNTARAWSESNWTWADVSAELLRLAWGMVAFYRELGVIALRRLGLMAGDINPETLGLIIGLACIFVIWVMVELSQKVP